MMDRRWAVVLAVMFLGACGAPQAARDGGAPADLALTLAMSGEGGRYTWFELSPDRTLGFSGGMDARQHMVKYTLTLTDEQVAAVWKLIVNEGLLEAVSADADDAKTRWNLTIRGGGGRAKVKSVDDAAPGIRRLHDLLFGYQADERYDLPGIGSGK